MIGDTRSYQINPSLLGGQQLRRVDNSADLSNPDASKTQLKAVVKELEALFIYELLKEMRQTTQRGFLGKGLGNDIYSSLFDMEVARLLADRGLGLGKMILKQMDRQGIKGSITPSTSSSDTELSSLNGKKAGVLPTAPKSEPKEPKAIDQESQTKIPVDGKISSLYGWREDPFSGEEKFHAGIDIAAPSGQEIYPIKKGRVIFSGLSQGYGNTVVIDHEDGFVSKYSHNLINLVSAGDEVDPDQVIALVGSTGKSTGPHLHFEVQYKGERVNPQILVQGGQGVTG